MIKIKFKIPFLHKKKELEEDELPLTVRRKEFPGFGEKPRQPSPFLESKDETEIFPMIETEIEKLDDPESGKEVAKVKEELREALVKSIEEKGRKKMAQESHASQAPAKKQEAKPQAPETISPEKTAGKPQTVEQTIEEKLAEKKKEKTGQNFTGPSPRAPLDERINWLKSELGMS